EPFRAYRGARKCKHGIDSYRSQERTLARHVGTADHEQHGTISKSNRVRHALGFRHKWVPKIRSVKHRTVVDDLRKRIVRMFVGVPGERTQRFELADRFQPRSNRRAAAATPLLQCERKLSPPQQEY